MSNFSKYPSRSSYYWSENKKYLLGYLALPIVSCLFTYFLDDYSTLIIGQKISSVFPIHWMFLFSGLSGIFIYHQFICATHPKYLFNKNN